MFVNAQIWEARPRISKYLFTKRASRSEKMLCQRGATESARPFLQFSISPLVLSEVCLSVLNLFFSHTLGLTPTPSLPHIRVLCWDETPWDTLSR